MTFFWQPTSSSRPSSRKRFCTRRKPQNRPVLVFPTSSRNSRPTVFGRYGKDAARSIKKYTTHRLSIQIEHQDGHDEVAIVRQFGNETCVSTLFDSISTLLTEPFSVRVIFSIGDIDTPQEVNEYDEEGNPIAQDEDATSNPAFAIRCAITITKVYLTVSRIAAHASNSASSKPNTGALSIDAVAEDGNFAVDNVSYYADAKLAGELSAEADWKRRGLYIGPQVCLTRPSRFQTSHINISLHSFCSSTIWTSVSRSRSRSTSTRGTLAPLWLRSSPNLLSGRSKRYALSLLCQLRVNLSPVYRSIPSGWSRSTSSFLLERTCEFKRAAWFRFPPVSPPLFIYYDLPI